MQLMFHKAFHKLNSVGVISDQAFNRLRKTKERICAEFTEWGFLYTTFIFPLRGFLRIKGWFGYDKPYKEILEYRDKYKGQKCYVIANGPSLKYEDVKMIEGQYTFAVNSIFRMYEKTQWRPTFYVLLDPLLHKRFHEEYDLDFSNYAKDRSILNASNRKIVRDKNNCIFLNYNYLDHVYHYGRSKKFKYTDNLLYAFYDNYSVTQDSMALAIYMGFDRIFLLGADNDYLGNKQHFDDDEGKRNVDIDYAYLAQRANDMGYKYIGKLAKRKGAEIYNCTRGGNVKEFERINLEESIRL